MVISTMQSLVNEDHRNVVGNSIHETTKQKKNIVTTYNHMLLWMEEILHQLLTIGSPMKHCNFFCK